MEFKTVIRAQETGRSGVRVLVDTSLSSPAVRVFRVESPEPAPETIEAFRGLRETAEESGRLAEAGGEP